MMPQLYFQKEKGMFIFETGHKTVIKTRLLFKILHTCGLKSFSRHMLIGMQLRIMKC